ncbi:hypothetical protein CYMTET_34454 [Cymbomonas tetramitiformis]|uniref:Uncharacterized protein n=1 Tax=Cymbomonas tetramitiformis TaxID=36881 RepID=A0AAE0KPU9_9CHLO|nr:hypothetical protein CYMTET_34454 [Cymbomonas tetramitiformis]
MTTGTYLVSLAPSKDGSAFNVEFGRRNSPWSHLVRCVYDPDVELGKVHYQYLKPKATAFILGKHGIVNMSLVRKTASPASDHCMDGVRRERDNTLVGHSDQDSEANIIPSEMFKHVVVARLEGYYGTCGK